MKNLSVFVSFIFLVIISCRKAPKTPESCDFENLEDNFTIVHNDDSPERPFNVFCKKVDVFGVLVYATESLSLIHI